MKIQSKLAVSELEASFDEFTSPARYAGSDDMFDDIFIAKRCGNKIYIARKPRKAMVIFTTVFRGSLVKTESGSAIKGVFTSTVADYIMCLVFAVAYGTIMLELYNRGTEVSRVVALCAVAVLLIVFALMPKKGQVKKYKALFEKIASGV